MINQIREQFRERFKKEPIVVTAPGRVNLIGEHTDYNQGFVLPGAVDKRIYIAMARNDVRKIRAYANEFDELIEFGIDEKLKPGSWKNYITGVTHFIQEKSRALDAGVDVMVDGDIPVGGGMSSSAALCCGYGFGLNQIFDLGLSRLDIAYIGQKTEHEYVGAKVGIMDQFASLHGKAGHVIKLDCRTLEYEYIPFDFPGHSIVLVNTMIKHTLASSEYNVRRQQCEEGVAILKQHYAEVESLRDVTPEMLADKQSLIPEVVYRRCKYVVEEKVRLLKGCVLLQEHELTGFGQLMYLTHKALSSEYEVSCPELDFLVEEAKKISGVEGARMMGGGFGGCTINIVKKDQVQTFSNAMREKYIAAYKKDPEVYITNIEDGVSIANS
jgi:galactokinase